MRKIVVAVLLFIGVAYGEDDLISRVNNRFKQEHPNYQEDVRIFKNNFTDENRIQVIDGDTFKAIPGTICKGKDILTAHRPHINEPLKPITFKLYGIDAPELDQPYGKDAKEKLQYYLYPNNANFVNGKLYGHMDFQFVVMGEDEYGRVIVRAITLFELEVTDDDVFKRIGSICNINLTGNEKYDKRQLIEINGYKEGATNIITITNINEEMIKNGYAWAYEQYLQEPYKTRYKELEQEKRNKSKGKYKFLNDTQGIWSDPNPIPPWEWRKNKGEEK
jgi:endonuclease YncB( thermonuclease family)